MCRIAYLPYCAYEVSPGNSGDMRGSYPLIAVSEP